MRIRRVMLLALAAFSLVVASGASASTQVVPGFGYVWAQPHASLNGVTSAEVVSVPSVASMLPSGGYVWAQPDASLVGVTTTQAV